MKSIPKKVAGYDLDNLPKQPIKEVAELSRKIGSEGAVLLKNDNAVLPILPNEEIAVFGRPQIEYIKSGTGSGGSVNTVYTVNIIDGIKNCGIKFNEEVTDLYRAFIAEHPFDYNMLKWATEAFAQPEMPLTDEIVEKAAKRSDKAIIVISRLCGEGFDFKNEKGAYELSDTEVDMIKAVRKQFDKVAVVFNICGIMDFAWVDEYGIDAAIITWTGGQEGGNIVADLLSGKATPSGKLTDTVARKITDYPEYESIFENENVAYHEDIYVGYRYFETFAKDKVLYPFGYGLSYTTFEKNYAVAENDGTVTVNATVKNTGNYNGAEVVQVYCEAPQGKLGKAARVLCGFKKTPVLKPNETCEVSIDIDVKTLASYDDSGVTGNKSCYILEQGNYSFYVGTDVRTAEKAYTYTIDADTVTERLTEICAPVKNIERYKPIIKNGEYTITLEAVPTRTVDLTKKIADARKEPFALTGDRGIMFDDLVAGKATVEEFTAQFTVEQLIELLFGEGMCSPKVMSGTAGAIGGLTKAATAHRIPPVCVADGPSGLRFDSGEKATLMPCGTLLGCTWNPEAVEDLYTYEGIELRAYGVDALLGPGANIHRHPLCGRNFEYFSEDPLITGTIASAEARGLAAAGTTPTIKHFACNNIETAKTTRDFIISERAIREIYLKCFEIPIKDGNTKAVMTAYNRVNGIQCSSNYDFNTTILRDEWGFDGLVMTDWWSSSNYDNDLNTGSKLGAMVRSQNDLYMVVRNAEEHASINHDDIAEMLEKGVITLYDIQRNVQNIFNFILITNAYNRFLKNGYFKGYGLADKADTLKTVAVIENPEKEKYYDIGTKGSMPCLIEIEYTAHLTETAQCVIISKSNRGMATEIISVNGLNGGTANASCELIVYDAEYRINYNEDEVAINKVTIKAE